MDIEFIDEQSLRDLPVQFCYVCYLAGQSLRVKEVCQVKNQNGFFITVDKLSFLELAVNIHDVMGTPSGRSTHHPKA